MPRKKRIDELLEKLGIEKIKEISLERAYTQSLTLNMLSAKYSLKPQDIRRILAYAIQDPTLITDSEARLIADRSSLNQFPHTQKAETFATKNYYINLLAERSRKKREMLETEEKEFREEFDFDSILNRISELETLIANYDELISSDEEQELPKEALEKELNHLKKLLERKV